VFAETKNAFIRDEDARFDAGVIKLLDVLAGAAHQRQLACCDFGGSQRRELRAPKMKVGINESQAIGVDAVGGTHLADCAACRFAIAIRTTKDELLLGGKFVMRNNASAVEAEEDGVGGLGENLAVEIAADQKDGNFFRNAGGDAHNLQWQVSDQNGGGNEPIQYLMARVMDGS
jgi:hypothetical protein